MDRSVSCMATAHNPETTTNRSEQSNQSLSALCGSQINQSAASHRQRVRRAGIELHIPVAQKTLNAIQSDCKLREKWFCDLLRADPNAITPEDEQCRVRDERLLGAVRTRILGHYHQRTIPCRTDECCPTGRARLHEHLGGLGCCPSRPMLEPHRQSPLQRKVCGC